ncbi:MAG: DNA photolyase [Deltaproteobacteria bacterium]|nr:DNA photolyase [Deltaproteobacteria bacterium]
MSFFYPERIFVERESARMDLTLQVLERCRGVPVEYVDDVPELIRRHNRSSSKRPPQKKQLLLCRNRGRFLEPCPGTKPDYLCCRYVILTAGSGCPLDCTYCVLLAYLNNPFITLFVNWEDMLAELESHGRLGNAEIVRIGTGEYMDSLALEHLTDFVLRIVSFFKNGPGAVLELKTKTAHIDHLRGLDHGGRVIVSWSLNAPEIVAREERGAASLTERLSAARELVAEGYRVGFHFDPLICYPGWETGYRETVDLIAEYIPPEAIAWISIGTLRYMPQLKTKALLRFPETKIYYHEFVPGLDGKMRYLQDIRIEMCRSMVEWLRAYDKEIFIYYCMENSLVWQKTHAKVPASNMQLKQMLDARI